jgi:DNA end-binding protein Ku
MRPLWKGTISFGLVTIPVGLFSAVERKEAVTFRLLHKKDRSPIDYRRVCEAEGVEVPWKDIVRGYPLAKGKYVIMDEADLAKAKSAATQTFEVREFVPAADIEDIYFEQPYYVAPAGKGSTKAYALLRAALEDSHRVGIGTIVLRQREHLAALDAAGPALVLTTMRFAHEIRSPASLELPKAADARGRELGLARQLIESLAADWDPKRYRDTYHDELMKVIKARAQGREIEAPSAPRAPKVVDLAEALRQSLQAAGRGEPRRAASRRRASRRRAA